nr:hypothetical protein [Baaleninema simplex]
MKNRQGVAGCNSSLARTHDDDRSRSQVVKPHPRRILQLQQGVVVKPVGSVSVQHDALTEIELWRNFPR